MTAIGAEAAKELTEQAAAVGITAQQIADTLCMRVDSLEVMSGRDRDTIERMIQSAEYRQSVVERAVHLAGLSGRDQAVVRANASAMSMAKLQGVVDAQEQHLRQRGVDTRTPTQRAASASAPATDRQVAYIADLLHRTALTGEGGGFESTKGLVDGRGRPVREQIAELTRADASSLIDSLRSDY